MSETFVIFVLLIVIAAIILLSGIIYMFKQKIIYDKENNRIDVEIDIPALGKMKTNSPALGFAFLGAALAGGVLHYLPQDPPTLEFAGEVLVEPESLGDVHVVVVGVTTSPWSQTATPLRPDGKIDVKIPVPVTWQTYSAYAFAHGTSTVRPVAVGLDRSNPEFRLELRR